MQLLRHELSECCVTGERAAERDGSRIEQMHDAGERTGEPPCSNSGGCGAFGAHEGLQATASTTGARSPPRVDDHVADLATEPVHAAQQLTPDEDARNHAHPTRDVHEHVNASCPAAGYSPHSGRWIGSLSEGRDDMSHALGLRLLAAIDDSLTLVWKARRVRPDAMEPWQAAGTPGLAP